MTNRKRVTFDHHTAEWVEDPFSLYDTLRDRCPVAYSEAHGGFWLLSRYRDVRGALGDWRTFSSNAPGRIAIPHTRPGVHPGIPIEFDPPEHTRYREVVAPLFSSAAVKPLEPQVAARANELLDGFVDREGCDIVTAYATPLLATTLALFLNLPLADVSLLESWADAIFAGRSRDPQGAARATEALTRYIAEQMELRKRHPGDDLFSTLVTAEVDGRRLTDSELWGYGRIILLAGREATIDGLSNSLWYLAQHPTEQRRLRAEPERMLLAVEEFLRYMSPIQLLGRVATCDVEFHGHTIREGDSVAMLYGSANRDQRTFERADACLLDRKPNPHLAFGSGHHYCLGAQLARLVLRVGIGAFLERVPSFRLTRPEDAVRKLNGDARGFVTLPVAFGGESEG